MTVNSIQNQNCILAECPVWNSHFNRLFWVDIMGNAIWCYNPNTALINRVWEDDYSLGGITFTKENELVLCSDLGVIKFEIDSEYNAIKSSADLLFDIKFGKGQRFNDITTDSAGRIFAGTMCDECINGVLYRLDEGMKPVILLDNLGISNGMVFSSDDKYFFHTDSKTKTITKYDYDINSGDISNPTIFYRGDEPNCMPDGCSIDIDDNIWVAFWGGSKVLHIDKNGKLIKTIEVPAKQVTSVMFGGQNMNTLFITTAAVGAVDISIGNDEDNVYLGGQIFYCDTDTVGRPERWI